MKLINKESGEEVKNANVSYFPNGVASTVNIDGVNYDAKAFDFEDDEPAKKTKPAVRKKSDSAILTTADVTVSKKK